MSAASVARYSSRRCSGGMARKGPRRSGGVSDERIPSRWIQTDVQMPSITAPPTAQNEVGYAATVLKASALCWRCSDSRRSGDTPVTVTSRSGPTGRAHTTVSAPMVSPPRRPTAQPPGATSIDSTTQPRRTRSPSSSVIRCATRGRALGHAEGLPARLVVEAVSAGGGLLAQLGQQRGALDRVGAERERHRLGQAQHPGSRPHRAHPRAHAQRVEPRGVGMAPGVGGIHAARKRGQLAVHAREILEVGRVHPGRVVADRDALVRAPRVGEAERRIAGLDREPELGRQLEVGVLPFGGQLPAQLHRAPVGQPLLLHAAARALAGLEHDHVGACPRQVARGGQPGQSGADHDGVSC